MTSTDRSSRIYHSARGTVHLPLGGQDRELRFRTRELVQLEQRRGKGILSMLNEDGLGLGFIKDAIIVGVSHEFIGKKGKQKKTLTEAMVEKWIDECDGEDGRLAFDELTEAVVKAVVSGMPGGSQYIDLEEEEAGPPSEAAA